MGKTKKARTPNDERSIVKNPNNPAYLAALVNTANQLNTNQQLAEGA